MLHEELSTAEIANMLRDRFESMSAEERKAIIDSLLEGYCSLCCQNEPCYCAPCYDE